MGHLLEILAQIFTAPTWERKSRSGSPEMDRLQRAAGWFFYAFLALVTLGVLARFLLF
jgi:hypothetical protein